MRPTGKRVSVSLKAIVPPLLFLGIVGHGSMLTAQSAGTFTATGNMTTARGQHTATLLPNGKVLITGGSAYGLPNAVLASAELYDPSTGTFAATGNMITARRSHRATLLPDGKVLITAGFENRNSSLASAELYDPSTGTFTATGVMITARAWHTATLLPDGRVLVAGGDHTAELYDPATGAFALTGAYAGPYAATNPVSVDTATSLPDGRVLITGCDCRSVAAQVTELYDPGTGTFSLTGTRGGTIGWWVNVNTATLLRNGKVLIVGSDEYDWPADAEVYDPATATVTGIGNTAAPHEFSTATLLRDGTVLVAGSQLPGGSGDASAELYDPAAGTFYTTENMTTGRGSHTATLLPGGRVLIAGGYSSWPVPTSSAELYVPRLLAPTPVLTLDSTKYCIGASWNLKVSNATPSAPIRLLGTTNGESWEIAQWQKTDANGSFSLEGTFAQGTAGSYTLSVEIGGVTSNAVSLVVSQCMP